MDVTVGGASKEDPSDPEEHKSIRNSTRDPTQGLANLTVPTYKRLGHIRNRVQCHGTELQEWRELHRCLPRPWRHHNSRQRTRRTRGLRGITDEKSHGKKFGQKKLPPPENPDNPPMVTRA